MVRVSWLKEVWGFGIGFTTPDIPAASSDRTEDDEDALIGTCPAVELAKPDLFHLGVLEHGLRILRAKIPLSVSICS